MTDEVTRSEDHPQEIPAAPQPQRKRKSIFADPVVRVMAIVTGALVVLYLVAVVSALLTGVLGSNVPTTKVQRDQVVYEGLVKQKPQDATIWAEYAGSLVKSGQFGKAQSVLDRAKNVANEKSTMALSTVQAQIYLSTKKYDLAIKTADKVRKDLKAYHDKAKKNEESPEFRKQAISENYYLVLITKAEAYAATGKTGEAIKNLDMYLKQEPTAADVLVRRGSLKLEAGDEAGAEKDFRAALRFLPDDPTANEGLKKIGAK